MWMNLYRFAHDSLGMHFWELPALIAGVVTVVELIVHTRKQKKREEKFEEEREEKREALCQAAGVDITTSL